MSILVQITITGDKRVEQKLKRLGSGLYNFKSAMDEIGKSGQKYFSGPAWLSQGTVFGNKWAALSNVTLLVRGINVEADNAAQANFAGFLLNKRGQSSRRGTAIGTSGASPLEDTGAMRQSFTYKSNSSSVVVTNSKSYFKYHQSTAPRRRLPRRQMIGASRGFRTIIRNVMKDDITRKIRNA